MNNLDVLGEHSFLRSIGKSRITRRSFVRNGGIAVAVSSVGVAGLLAACGGSNSSGSTSTANSSSGSTAVSGTSSTGASTSTSATTTSTSATTTSTNASTVASGSGATPAAGSTTFTESTAAGSPKSGGTLKWGYGSKFYTLDPHVSSAQSDYQVESHVFDQLVIRDEAGTPTPFLATKWAVSTDGLQYTFTLKSGVKFHDGTPFNAAAVKFNFDRIVDPETKSEQAIYNLGPYDHTDVVDDSTAMLTLKTVFVPLILGLAEYPMGMVSPTAAQKQGKDFGQSPVGSGPFKFKEWIQNDHVTIVKNPDYNWAPSVFKHSGPAYLDEIVYQLISESSTLSAALKSGQLDLIMPTPDNDVAGFKKDASYVVTSTIVQGFPPSLMFNVTKPPTDDVKVRQALSYGVDRDGINKAVYDGDQILAKGIWKETDPYYWGGANGWYPYDPKMCEQLLDEAGWKKGSDGMRAKDGQKMEVIYLTLPGQIQGIAELVQTEYQSYGVKMDIKVEDNPAQQQDAQKGTQNIVWLNWLLADPYGLETVFGSENSGTGWNFSHYSNPQVDQWFKQGVETSDEAQRKELYVNVQKQIYQDAAVYPINYNVHNWTFRKQIQGFIVDPSGIWVHFYDTWISQ